MLLLLRISCSQGAYSLAQGLSLIGGHAEGSHQLHDGTGRYYVYGAVITEVRKSNNLGKYAIALHLHCLLDKLLQPLSNNPSALTPAPQLIL